MRKALKYPLQTILKLTLLTALLAAGCTFQKKSGFNRSMQNLTAYYNILFDANELIRAKQESYAAAFVDNYNEVLNVYQDTIAQTGTPDKDLELAIVKGNTIINTKEQSHYQSDAYILLGKANYYEGNYFNAAEYFNYVIRTYKSDAKVAQQAYVWKGRTLLYLNQLPEAKLALDTALLAVNPKINSSFDAYPAKLQYDIDVQDYADGEEMAKAAVQHAHGTIQQLRWKFILAQLQELNHHTADAYQNYSQIARSNAAFEMAFNASLNRIRITDAQDGIKLSREDRLKALLKDPNNKEFKDQIYYQIAQLQLADNKVDKAIGNYKLSVRYNLRNQNQRGLSYLRLAEIYFKNKADYLTSKKYYDSTLTALPVNYPGYRSIQKLSNNLQLLADRMQIITREDTLQALARMDEKTRKAVIDKMVNDKILQQQTDAAAATSRANLIDDAGDVGTNRGGGGSTFYFYNVNAVSQGYNTFKQIWGNRKLEDNWRRSMRDNSNITNNASPVSEGIDPDSPPVGQQQNGKGSGAAINYRQSIVNNLPLTPALLEQSNLRVYNAYLDLANFYRDVLDDKPEAIATFELLLRRFPNDLNKPAVYYSLYRLYSENNIARSDGYKNRILKEYPATPFAKVIIDPDYVKKLSDKDAEFTAAYNRVFDLYTHRKYSAVVDSVPLLQKNNPNNRFSAQLAYLQALAAGHNEKAGPFRDSLEQIVKRYPDDKLITPLAKQNLAYINANQAEVMSRAVVLPDDNPGDLPFTLSPEYKETTEYRHAPRGGSEPVPQTVEKPKEKPAARVIAAVKPPDAVKAVSTPVKKDSIALKPATTPDATDPDAASYNFTKADSTNYFFAVNVSTGTTNLASSRFGIGQFDRANYAGKGIKHQLMAVGDDNQVIYVGRFFSLKDVKDYARAIVPLLPDIMKVPKDKYTFFIVTQGNLSKLTDKKALDSYMNYYHKNY